MLYKEFLDVVDEKKDVICGTCDYIFDNPELCFLEKKAVQHLKQVLKENGFVIEDNLVGIPTAFKASYGVGKPSIGVLAEFDAVAGMSQVGGEKTQKSIDGMDASHCCGHNLFAGGSLGAVLAIKSYIEKTGKGKISLFGCPAEEGGGGKVFMARDGAFEGIDAVVSWHPESMYMVRTRPALANIKINYHFEGISAHAGADPHKGRSALDAVELMNIGANFLREHMEQSCRVHYAILDAGGTAPNMVQSHATVSYMMRASDCESVQELKERVDRIAQGATLMTDTTVKSEVVSAYANLITIPTLQKTANESMQSIPVPIPTEEELEYGKALQSTMKLTAEQKALPPFATFVKEPAPPVPHGGSTDTADVSWVVPTVQMHIANWVLGTPGHSWQSASQSRGSFAKKATLYASKAVAGTVIRLFENQELIDKAKAEHFEKTSGKYISLLPKELKYKG